MRAIPLSRLTLIFLRTGSLTFGGGDPTMAVLYSELVSERGWLSPEKYMLAYALARVTPGTNLLAFCAGAAWELRGWIAAILAVLAATIPSAAIVLAMAAGYEGLQNNRMAMAAIAGTLAAASGMMLTGAFQLVRPHLIRRRWLHVALITPAAVLLSYGLGLSPLQVLLLAALVGCFWQVPQA